MSISTDDEGDHHETKRCISCFSEIPLEARKCKVCGSYQDWQRYFIFSNTAMSLLIAFFSVATLMATSFLNVYERVFDNRAELVLTGTTIHPNSVGFTMDFLLVNFGKKPGVLAYYMHCYYLTDDGKVRRVKWSTDQSYLVNPGKALMLTFKEGENDGEDREPAATDGDRYYPVKPERSAVHCTYYTQDSDTGFKINVLKKLYLNV